MKRGLTISALTAMLLAGATFLQAEPGNFGVNGANAWNQPPQKRVKHTDQFGDTYYTLSAEKPKKYVDKEVKKASKHFKKAPQEVISGLNATLVALDDMQKNNLKAAKEKLQKATQLFDQALKTNPNLKLVPIDNEIKIYQLDESANDIKSDVALVRKLLKSYHTQAARDILMPLKDEMDITTHFIPMDLYPKATKDALKLLENGKKDEAIRALVLGMSTIVAEEVTVPIPLLKAQNFTTAASKMAAKDPKEAIKHLRLAKNELHKALLLGYTDKHSTEYESIYDQMTKIQKEIKAKHHTSSLFKKIGKDIESLLHKTHNEKRELKDSGSVWKNTVKAHAAAAHEENKDKLHFEKKMQTDNF